MGSWVEGVAVAAAWEVAMEATAVAVTAASAVTAAMAVAGAAAMATVEADAA